MSLLCEPLFTSTKARHQEYLRMLHCSLVWAQFEHKMTFVGHLQTCLSFILLLLIIIILLMPFIILTTCMATISSVPHELCPLASFKFNEMGSRCATNLCPPPHTPPHRKVTGPTLHSDSGRR